MNIDLLIQSLTLEEKCQLLVGKDAWHTASIERLNIPSIMMADGPHGLRKQLDSKEALSANESYQAVCFPPAVTVASSFDPMVVETMAGAIADECRYKDVQILLGPGLNIKRSPLCGRNFEYYSEDPLVSGEMAAAFVRGLEKKNVGACLKHFALNSQETYRMISNSVCDSRAFYEVYTAGFRRALLEKPAMVMCSYNRVDGSYASENVHLLKTVLREEYGFDQVIVSDWTAVNDRSMALKATLDLEMPGHDYAVKKLIHDYHQQQITMEEIDQSVRRLLTLVESKMNNKIIPFDLSINHHKAYEIAKESFVLLKNENDILPLKSKEKVAFIGALAKASRYQGGGSSHINAFRVDHLIDYISDQCEFAEGYRLEGDGYDIDLIQEAKKIALKADKVVLVVGLTDEYESEGYDRQHLNLPEGQIELIKAITSIHDQVVLVLQTGSPVLLPMIDKIKGVLNTYLMGEAGAKAAIELLYGQANPSGRLAETFPNALEDTPAYNYYAKGNGEVHYQESVYVGYRYYSSLKKPVLFPFGHGLSYTTFDYAHFAVQEKTLKHPHPIELSVDVTNTGYYIGKDVIQIYVRYPKDCHHRPDIELKAFKKVSLDPNETKTVNLSLSTESLSYYDETMHQHVVVSGNYELILMKNAIDVIDSLTVYLEGDRDAITEEAKIIARSYHINHGLTFESADFERLIHRPMGESSVHHKRPYGLNNTFMDISKTIIGGILYRFAHKEALKAFPNPTDSDLMMVEKSLAETPLRAIVAFSGGKLKMKQIQGLLELINHRYIKAFRSFLGKW